MRNALDKRSTYLLTYLVWYNFDGVSLSRLED